MEECPQPVLFATITAVLAGGIIGVVRGGSFIRLSHLEIRLAWLAGLAWLLQVAVFASPLTGMLDAWVVAIHLVSIVMVAIVIVANRAIPGVAVFGVGLLLNALVISANGGFMPVSAAAISANGDTANLAALEGGEHVQKAVLMRADSPFWFLGDLAPVPPIKKVYSPGDLVAALGAVLMVVQGMGRSESRADRLPTGS
jgi:uncharacterized protein DUF5317